MAKLPNVVCLIDGTHVPIIKPVVHGNDYYQDRKSMFSLNT